MNTIERLTRALTSGRVTPQETEGSDDATRQRILDAGLQQLELFGLRRSTMDDIARRAGVSRVTVYRYFSSKDELLDAVLLRELSRLLDELRSLLAGLDSDEDRIVETFGFIVRVMRSNVLLQRLVRGEPELVVPQLTTEGGSFLALIRSFLAEGLLPWVPPNLSKYEVTVMAEITVRLLVSFLLTPETAIRLDDPDDIRAAARRYLLPLLGRPVTSRRRSPR